MPDTEQGPTFGQKAQAAARIVLMSGAMMVNSHAVDLNHSTDLADQSQEPTPIEQAAGDYLDLEKEVAERRKEREERSKEEPEPTQASEKLGPESEKKLAEIRAEIHQFSALQKERANDANERDR